MSAPFRQIVSHWATREAFSCGLDQNLPGLTCGHPLLPLPTAVHTLCGASSPPPSLQKSDDIEEGDLPEHRPSAPIDFSQIDPGKPESILKMTKKGKTLMMFVTVSGNPTEGDGGDHQPGRAGKAFNAFRVRGKTTAFLRNMEAVLGFISVGVMGVIPGNT